LHWKSTQCANARIRKSANAQAYQFASGKSANAQERCVKKLNAGSAYVPAKMGSAQISIQLRDHRRSWDWQQQLAVASNDYEMIYDDL
jgi:hypothetical protein